MFPFDGRDTLTATRCKRLAMITGGLALGDLAEVHLDERLAPEDVHQDLELHVVGR